MPGKCLKKTLVAPVCTPQSTRKFCRRADFQYTVNTLGRLVSAEQSDETIVKANADGTMVRMRDIGRAELGAQNYLVDASLDGKPATTLLVFQLPGANSIEVSNRGGIIRNCCTEMHQNV